jgi:hypothetical protein
MSVVHGWQSKGYRDSASSGAGNPASPTWSELGELSDVKIDASQSEADASVREAGGIELTEPSMLQVTVTATLQWRANNANCLALLTAFQNRVAINMMFLTGASNDANARGYKGDFKVFGFPIDQPLKDLVKIELTFRPCVSTRSPTNYVQAASGSA